MKHHGMLFNVVETEYSQRSLGIYRIAHYLREQNLDIEVIDYANFWTLEQLKTLFKSRFTNNTKFIGFSHLFSMWDNTLEIFCKWIKENYSGIKIISGSAVNPAFNSDYIDYYIRGYGEHAIVALLNYLISNGPAPKFMFSGNKKIIDAIAFYPAFPMKSLMVRYEDRDFLEPHEWLNIEFARGCRFSCKFCSFPVLGVKHDYSRDAEDFELQVKDTYDRFGISNYLIADETFNDSSEKITKFADVVEKLDFDTWFSGYIRADLLATRPHDREELLRMNVLGHHHGIESINQASLKSIGKGMSTEKVLETVLESRNFFMTHGSGRYRTILSFIVGLPHDTPNDFEKLKRWLVENWQWQAFTVYPLSIGIGELDKKSEFSKNYREYGYVDLTDDEIEQEKKKLGGLEPRGIMQNIVKWKNSAMTFYDACIITQEFVSLKSQYVFPTSSMNLGQILQGFPSLDEKLKMPTFEGRRISGTAHLQAYIHKKLSL